MIPARPDPDTPRSERKVFKELSRQLPADWVVLHSRRFVLPADRNHGAVEGEVDFIVLIPDRGYIGIEVKGGAIGRNESGWFTIDRHKKRHRINPVVQATRAVHSIDQYLRRHRWFADHDTRLGFAWCVVFPDVAAPRDLGPDLPKELVIDHTTMSDVKSRLEVAFDSLAGATRLTGEQTKVLDVLSEMPRVGVHGGAGTGKTVLAVEKARRLAGEGLDPLFLCFNRSLADHLSTQADGITIDNFHRFCARMAVDAKLEFEPPNDADESAAFWGETAADLLLEALDRLPDKRWDALIVDEGQDFKEYWWLALEKALKDDGDACIYVFSDPSQNIYEGSPAEFLGLSPARLTVNCRNTRKIADYSYGLIDQEPCAAPECPEGVEVTEVDCEDDAEMCDQVRRALHELIVVNKIPSAGVAVLSAHGVKHSVVWKQKRFGNFSLVALGKHSNSTDVTFSSLQRFKGLEADAVILCEIGRDTPFDTPMHYYVGASRAKHLLTVLRYS
jgi:ATP:corrinoid adenosyltransferase